MAKKSAELKRDMETTMLANQAAAAGSTSAARKTGALLAFLKNANWRDGCKYLLEQPYQDIPTMINNKLIRHFLKPFIK